MGPRRPVGADVRILPATLGAVCECDHGLEPRLFTHGFVPLWVESPGT